MSLITAVLIWLNDVQQLDGYLNMTPKQRENYEASRPNADNLERAKLLGDSTADLSPDDLLQPVSDTQIRNRYLSRIGAPVN